MPPLGLVTRSPIRPRLWAWGFEEHCVFPGNTGIVPENSTISVTDMQESDDGDVQERSQVQVTPHGPKCSWSHTHTLVNTHTHTCFSVCLSFSILFSCSPRLGWTNPLKWGRNPYYDRIYIFQHLSIFQCGRLNISEPVLLHFFSCTWGTPACDMSFH